MCRSRSPDQVDAVGEGVHAVALHAGVIDANLGVCSHTNTGARTDHTTRASEHRQDARIGGAAGQPGVRGGQPQVGPARRAAPRWRGAAPRAAPTAVPSRRPVARLQLRGGRPGQRLAVWCYNTAQHHSGPPPAVRGHCFSPPRSGRTRHAAAEAGLRVRLVLDDPVAPSRSPPHGCAGDDARREGATGGCEAGLRV